MRRFRGILFVASSAILYGVQPTFVTLSYLHGGNSFSVTFLMVLGASVALGFMVLAGHQPFRISRSIFVKLLILNTFGNCSTSLLLYYSYTRIPSGLAVSLHYLYPIVVAILLAVFFHERLTLRKIIALLIAVVGIAMISGIHQNGVDSIDPIGVTAALISSICWGFYIVYIEKSGIATHDSRLMNFYMALFSIPICAAAVLLTGSVQPITFPMGWIGVAGACLIGRVLAGPLFQKGIHGTGPLMAGVLATLEPITAMLLSIVLSEEVMTPNKLIGSSLVIVAACLMTLQKDSPYPQRGIDAER